jgi:hypothetical protein
MTDEQLEAAFELLQGMVDQRLGEKAKIVGGMPDPAALPAPSRKPRRKRGAEATASPPACRRIVAEHAVTDTPPFDRDAAAEERDAAIESEVALIAEVEKGKRA